MTRMLLFVCFAVSVVVLSAGCEERPPPASFEADVRPILDRHCTKCHQAGGDGYEKSGFSTESYGQLMSGTRFGPVVIAGDSFDSNLIVLVEGRADPSITMPHGERKLTEDEIGTLKAWIDQGAEDN